MYSIQGFESEYIFEQVRNAGQFYELSLLEELQELLGARQGLIVDVGANLGNHTVFFSGVLNRNVVAVEPEPKNVELLRKNVNLNRLGALVDVHAVAAWEHNGTVSIEQNLANNRGTFRVAPLGLSVACKPLSDIVGNRRVAAMKIDVEGAELQVIRGAIDIIKRDRPLISAELHSSSARAEVGTLLEEQGYILCSIVGYSDNYIWIPREGAEPHLARKLVENGRRLESISRKELSEIEKLTATTENSHASAQETAQRDLDAFSLGMALERLTNAADSLSEGRQVLRRDIDEGFRRMRSELDTLKSQIRFPQDFPGSDEQTSQRGTTSISTTPSTEESNGRGPSSSTKKLEREAISPQEPQSSPGQRFKRRSEVNFLTNPLTTEAEVTQSHSAEQPAIRSAQTSSGRNLEGTPERFHKLLRGYGLLARRLEEADPQAWDAETIVNKAIELLNTDTELEEVLPPPTQGLVPQSEPRQGSLANTEGTRHARSPRQERRRDPVRIGIASMTGREAGLARVLEILRPQADEICVYLNEMEEVPPTLPDYPNVSYFVGPDLGDRGKFAFIRDFDGYYITCDDDIEYAPFHVQSLIDGIERYDRRAIVGWHGSIFKENFEEFYNPKYRQVLSFSTLRGKDTPVHLLGTGVCGFHTSTVNVSPEDFKLPNMADAFLAILAKKQKVPMMVLAHEKGWAKPIDMGSSISTVSLKKHKGNKSDLDVGTTVSNLIKANKPWRLSEVTPSYTRKPFSVAFIGRTDKSRWKKGGILKSAHLTADMLNRFQVSTILEDIETGDPYELSGRDAQIVMIYVGDPERPDFQNVERIIDHHATAGRKVIVNFSINGVSGRNKLIADRMTEWRERYAGSVRLMVFSEAARNIPALARVRDLMVVIPKTIALPDPPRANFAHSKGIFLGDIAKMSDELLLDYPAEAWIASIRKSVPGVPLYAVKQYAPKKKIPLDVDMVFPFLDRNSFAEKISQARVMISMVKYATFEMVPLEVASLGLPVIYPEMPQSLSEYLGLSGLSIDSPKELEAILPTLYYDPIVWRSFSDSAIERANSAELNRLAGQTYLRLLALLNN